jgi:hypothetical protein
MTKSETTKLADLTTHNLKPSLPDPAPIVEQAQAQPAEQLDPFAPHARSHYQQSSAQGGQS